MNIRHIQYLISLCVSLRVSPTYAAQITNFQRDVVCSEINIFRPKTESEVVDIVKNALSGGRKVKMTTGNFASSHKGSCVDPGGDQIISNQMDAILNVDTELSTATVQPGIKLWDFNQRMHKEYGMTLPVVQEYGDVTLGGMLGNSTHGSSLVAASSSLQDRVVSLRVVNGLGDVITVEGADLDFFGGNLGVLGIVTSVTIKLDPTFKVVESTSIVSDQQLENDITTLASLAYSVSITWFPNQKNYTVLKFDPVSNTTPGEGHNQQVEIAWWKRKLFPRLLEIGNIPGFGKVMSFLEVERLKVKGIGYFGEGFGRSRQNAVGWSHEMINFTCRVGCPMDEFKVSLQEIAIPLNKLPILIAQIRLLNERYPTAFPLNGVYFRFGKETRGALSMAQGRDTAYVGIEYTLKEFGNHYPYNFEVIQELEQFMIARLDGRPSWGKNKIGNFAAIRKKYPRFEDFDAYRRKNDPKNVFLNDFYRQIASNDADHDFGEGCVVDKNCYCQRDSHCPDNYLCVKGLVYTEANVCRYSPGSL